MQTYKRHFGRLGSQSSEPSSTALDMGYYHITDEYYVGLYNASCASNHFHNVLYLLFFYYTIMHTVMLTQKLKRGTNLKRVLNGNIAVKSTRLYVYQSRYKR